MKIVFTIRAAAEMRAQLDWLVERSPRAARKAERAIYARLAMLAEFPRSAPAVDAALREVKIKFGRDGFVARYTIARDTVFIVRVFQGRQDR